MPAKDIPGAVDLTYYLNHPKECAKASRPIEWDVAFRTMWSRGIMNWEKRKLLPGFSQYGFFFAAMLIGREVTGPGRFVSPVYFYNRDSDDRADGDRSAPAGYANPRDYLLKRRSVIEQVFSPHLQQTIYGDKVDILLVDSANQAKQRGIDIKEEFLAITNTMIIDEERRRTRKVLTKAELEDYFYKLDFACGSGSLKIAGETVNPHELENLSLAVRTMFNLRDFAKDIKNGIVNIPLEDVNRLGVDVNQLMGMSEQDILSYRPMRIWFREQTAEGLGYLSRSQEEMARVSLKQLTRIALQANFIKPTEKGLGRFQRILAS